MLSPRLRFLAVAACAAAFALPALAATPTIDTYSGWNKTTAVSSFGCPDTTTFGQVITIPSDLHHLDKFTFWLEAPSAGGGPMVVRAYVYRWDGTNFTVQFGSKYESPPRTISYPDTLFHAETFYPAVTVAPGAQYVMFASIDREYVDCKNSYGLVWGWISGDVYPGGSFVYQNNAGDDLKWTTGWGGFSDLAFKAYLSP
jgi:hypothetical protein